MASPKFPITKFQKSNVNGTFDFFTGELFVMVEGGTSVVSSVILWLLEGGMSRSSEILWLVEGGMSRSSSVILWLAEGGTSGASS